LTTTKAIRNGETFRTEIIPQAVNIFQESLIIVGQDSIWTNESKGIFETKKYKQGINKIPATYILKKNGQLVNIPFEIEFEAK
jgi:hypothetical protein